MSARLKILTLNCWGLRVPILGAQLVDSRMTAIAEHVHRGDYDIIILQEVFSARDYVTLSCKILEVLPYTHFYHSGFMSSGVCIFSKYPILETTYQDFPLNGHAHKLFHGDWYGSKGCGLCILKVKDFIIHVYSTHMHARYNHSVESDEYSSHRASQAFHLSQFVKLTSKSCDAVILAGDFNCTPEELAYRVIRCNAAVEDAWLNTNADGDQSRACTCDTPHNSFTSMKVKAQLPVGQRIDYIFYRANDLTDIQLHDCSVLTNKIPGKDYDYSDHYPVVATLTIKRNVTARQAPEIDSRVRAECLKQLIGVMDQGIRQARYSRYFYFVTMLLSLMMLLLCREYYIGDSGSLHFILEVLQGLMAVSAVLSWWISFVLSRVEQNAHMAQKMDLQNLLQGASLSKFG